MFEKRKSLKLLFVSDVSIANVIGGAERVLYEQCVRLAQRGHAVHILTRRLKNHNNNHESIKGILEWRYNYHPSNPIQFLKSTSLNARAFFAFLHQNHNYDCINFHQPFSAFGVINSSLSNFIPKIYTCHSLSFEEFISRNSSANSLIKKIINFINVISRKKIEEYVLGKSSKIVVLSEYTRKKLRNIFKIPTQKIAIIPGGVDLQKFKIQNNKINLRNRLNIPKNKTVILTVRNLIQRMGLENLITALNNLIKQKLEVYLVIGGEGPWKNALIALTRNFGIDNYIKFVGFVPEEQLPSYYQMADLFILPTKELEGFGLVTIEAMACGLPVLGTKVGATKEILGQFNSDFLFENSDPESISELISKNYKLIRHNPHKWKEISLKCRQFVEKNYSWDFNIDSLERLFFDYIQK